MTGLASPGAISDDEFSGLIDPLGPFPKKAQIAVALSGGPDSLALALLTLGWAKARGHTLRAYTVDHGLRSGSADEARWVNAVMSERGVQHRILAWHANADEPVGQANARDARYRLLQDACREDAVVHLLVAHHLEDQAETVVQRLERQTGLTGLSGMAPIALRHDIRILRPLLSIAKSRLRATCLSAGLNPVDDPTNVDDRFDRVRVRRLIQAGARSTAGSIAAASNCVGQIAASVEREASAAFLQVVRLEPQGYAWLYPDAFGELSPLLGGHVLSRVIQAVGGAEYLRAQPIEEVARWLRRSSGKPGGRTVGRAYLSHRKAKNGKPRILICREPSTVPDSPVSAARNVHWDGRFMVDVREFRERGALITPVGKEMAPTLRKIWDCPADVASELPVMRQRGEIIALPQFSFQDRLDFGGNVASFVCRWRPLQPVTKPDNGNVGVT